MNTLKTYPHSPKFDCVKMYPFKYDRKEIFNCPTWRSFLGESWIPTEKLDGVLPKRQDIADVSRCLPCTIGKI